MSKSARSRVGDSPPLTLQIVMVVWSSNIADNVSQLPEGGDFESDRRSGTKLHLIPPFMETANFWIGAVSGSGFMFC